MKLKKWYLLIIVFFIMTFVIIPQAYTKEMEKVFSIPKEGLGELKGNYMLDLVINSKDANRTISLMISDTKFSLSQFFPEITIAFQGMIQKKNSDTFTVKYKLGLNEKVSLESDTEKKEFMWVENGCESTVILELDNQISLFETNSRSYKLRFRKLK